MTEPIFDPAAPSHDVSSGEAGQFALKGSSLAARAAAPEGLLGFLFGDGGLVSVLWRAAVDTLSRPFYATYERTLAAQASTWRKPKHIGIVMDGNRRFARILGSDVSYGHKRGADKLREMLDWCFECNIPVVTV